MKKRKILALGLSLALGLGFVSNSYASEVSEDNMNVSSELDERLQLVETKQKFVWKIDDLNLSFSQAKEIIDGIVGSKSLEEIEKVYSKAISKSEDNEQNFPKRTYNILKNKRYITYELRSLEISDDGVISGNYEKEYDKDISKEDYDFVIEQANKINDGRSLSSLSKYIDYVSKDKIHYEEPSEWLEEEKLEKPEEERPEEGDLEEKPEYKDPEADKTLLKKLLDKKYKKEDYTEDSYKFYTMIHTASKKIYDDKEAYQSDVDKALTNLNTAINLLEKVEKTEENKDAKEDNKDKSKPTTDKEKPEKNINKKIEEVIHRIEVKLGGLKYIKEAMPETYKRYKDIMDDAIADTEKALKQAKEFLKN